MAFGLGVAALGVLIAMVGLTVALDPWNPDWGDGLGMIGVGLVLGVLPGLVSAGLARAGSATTSGCGGWWRWPAATTAST